MKLGLFTAPHYSSQKEACTTRRPSLSLEKIREALAAMRDADLILCLGDLINDCGDFAENSLRLREAAALLHDAPAPAYCLMGNHDYEAFTYAQFQEISGRLAPPFVLHLHGKTLLFPNTAYREDGTPYDGHPVDWTDSFLPDGELERMRRVLDDPDVREVYVFLHQNLDPDVEKHHIIRNASPVRQLLAESGKVKTVFQGHYHPGHTNTVNGIPYVTLPAMCEGTQNRYEIIEL